MKRIKKHNQQVKDQQMQEEVLHNSELDLPNRDENTKSSGEEQSSASTESNDQSSNKEFVNIKENPFLVQDVGDVKAGKINKYDIFWMKVWALIVSINLTISLGINKVIKWIFKKGLPLKYIRAAVAIIFTIIFISIIVSPFRINVQKEQKYEVFSDGLIAYQEYIGVDQHSNPIYRWGFKDKNGKKKIPAKYLDVTPFSQGVAFAFIRKETQTATKDVWIMINKSGKQIGSAEFYSPGIFREEEGKSTLARVQDLDLTWAFVNKKGNLVVSALSEASDFKEHRARVKKGAVEYFINESGKTISNKYFETRSFSNGLAAFKDETGLWGYINKSGKVVIPPEFINVGPFLDKYAKVRIGNSVTYIDKKGQKLFNANINFKAYSKDYELIDFDKPITTYAGYPVIQNASTILYQNDVPVLFKQK